MATAPQRREHPGPSPGAEAGPAAVAATGPEPEADLAHSGARLAGLAAAIGRVRGSSAPELVELLADRRAGFDTRFAAGTLLALLGDPRLDPDRPEMLDLPAATVAMGLEPSRLDEVAAAWAHVGVERPWIAKELPRHQVRVGAFRMARFPVTNGEYLRFVLDRPEAERPSSWPHGTIVPAAANHPVFTVSPEAADAYAAWLSARTGRRFRLPSEAEWEYAATGGDGRSYPWGETWDPQRANTAEAGPLCSTPVGMYPEGDSPVGCADMAGNVEEYVADRYAPYPGGDLVEDDLTERYPGGYRIARGGSFARHGDLARCQRRHGWYPSPHYAMGFRLAEDVHGAHVRGGRRAGTTSG